MKRQRRVRGSLLGALALVVLVLGAAAIVMAVTNQSRVTRLTHASLTTGRYVAELAASAIDETLADFPDITATAAEGRDMRAHLLGGSAGGVVPGEKVLPVEALDHVPERTAALIREANESIVLSPVRLKPLYFNTAQNFGEIELECAASFRGLGGNTMFRRWTVRFYFQLDQGGKSFRVNAVARSAVLDRSADP